jgi:hypothetical protein
MFRRVRGEIEERVAEFVSLVGRPDAVGIDSKGVRSPA